MVKWWHRPRWLWRLHANFFGYFWIRCDVCNRWWSGAEWNDPLCVVQHGYIGHAVCSRKCAEKGNSNLKFITFSSGDDPLPCKECKERFRIFFA